MSTERIPQEWLNWLAECRNKGCDEQELFNILIKNGFPAYVVQREFDSTGIKLEHAILADQMILAKSMERLHYWLRDDWLDLPFAKKISSEDFEGYIVDNFLSDGECDRIASVIKSENRPSSLTKPNPDKSFRTSSSCNFHHCDDFLVPEIDNRMARYLGINPFYAEFMEGQYYRPGQQFKPHPDYFDDSDYAEHCIPQGQRTWTFMIYLNEPESGGETEFINTGIKITPKKGMALIWNNLDHLGVRNRNAMHSGLPVLKGEKLILTKWFRQFPREAAISKEHGQYTKVLTETGWHKTKMPDEIFKRLQKFTNDRSINSVPEYLPEIGVVGTEKYGSVINEIPKSLRTYIMERLKNGIETWAGVPIEPVKTYGVRTYLRGAVLHMHRDHIETHVASAILNIDQKVDQPWTLHIEDHYCRTHEIALEPGEMLLYEGARLQHGRPNPLIGDHYSNLFVHYQLSTK